MGAIQDISLHILIVDDDKALQDVTGQMLQRMGYRTTAVGDGNSALQLLQQTDVDLMLLDSKMPGMSGPELFKKVRSQGYNLPVVFTSGAVDAQLQEALQSGHGVVLLHKPFNMGSLREAIQGQLAVP